MFHIIHGYNVKMHVTNENALIISKLEVGLWFARIVSNQVLKEQVIQ